MLFHRAAFLVLISRRWSLSSAARALPRWCTAAAAVHARRPPSFLSLPQTPSAAPSLSRRTSPDVVPTVWRRRHAWSLVAGATDARTEELVRTDPTGDASFSAHSSSSLSSSDLTSFSRPRRRWWAAAEDGRIISTLLVCGDGDLSYSAGIAKELSALGVSLTATVLEDREAHHATYRNSRTHTETVLSSCPSFSRDEGRDKAPPLPSETQMRLTHEVLFGVDATDLPSRFGPRTFDRVQFNFPHWRGKANHRQNRTLLSAFLRSAADVLSPSGVGEVHVAFCEGQGGATASTRDEWRGSWKAAEYANLHGLLLWDVFLFSAEYDLSSHRGMDRGFKVGGVPKMYVFKKLREEGVSTGTAREFQLCCRHELHVNLPDVMTDDATYSLDDIIAGEAVREIIEQVVPSGIRVEVPMRKCLEPEETGSDCRVGVYLVVYCGQSKPLTRTKADEYRSRVEMEIAKHVPLRRNRAGRMVSRPFPYPLLQGLIKHYLSRG